MARTIPAIPPHLRERYAAVVAITDAVCASQLNDEYAALCRRMCHVLALRAESLLAAGEPRTVGAGIVHAVGWVNFLTDPRQSPHLTTRQLSSACGVGASSMASSFRVIRDELHLHRLHPDWTLPSKVFANPFVSILVVDGIPIDIRSAPRALQEEALRAGVIPFIPPTSMDDTSASARASRGIIGEIESAMEQAFRGRRAPGPEELQAVLSATADRHNHAPQPDFGGLSPHDVRRLVASDWESDQSAITLHAASTTLGDLASATTLHDVRALFAILADKAWGAHGVKATPKGNLPRTVVGTFRERAAQYAPEREAWLAEVGRPRNEEDFAALYRARIVSQVAGLVRRRSGRFSLTRRAESLRADDKAGELLVLLARTQFRRVDLAHFDGAVHVPDFQRRIGYTLARFAQVGSEWSTAADLLPQLIVPTLREAFPPSDIYDPLALILDLRFLSVLEGLGLAERNPSPYARGAGFIEGAFRKSALFDRVVRIRLEDAGEDDREPRR